MKCVFEKYCPLLIEMTIDSTTFAEATNNLDQLCDVQVMFGLACFALCLPWVS